MSLKVAVIARWINMADLDPAVYARVCSLIDFFVTHSPCRYQSNKPYPLNQVWGPSPWSTDRALKRRLDHILFGSDEVRLFNCRSKEEMGSKLAELGMDHDYFHLSTDCQWAVYTKVGSNGNDSMYMSLFYHIRNALAHARWMVTDDNYFVFEDGKANGSRTTFEVSARGVLRLESLIEVVDFITHGSGERTSIDKQILGAIKSGTNTKKRIKEQLQINESEWRTYSQVLRREGKIVYLRGVWQLL